MGGKKARGDSVAVRIAAYFASHDGVITAGQAYAAGMTAGGVRCKVRAGLWVPHARSVYLSAEHQMTDMARLRIATAACGGTADRSAAAWLHGLILELPDTITMSVSRSAHGGGACAVQSDTKRRDFPAEDVTTVCGVSTVGVPLAILQVAAVLDPDCAIGMMDRALQTKRVGLRALRDSLETNRSQRPKGCSSDCSRSTESPDGNSRSGWAGVGWISFGRNWESQCLFTAGHSITSTTDGMQTYAPAM